LRDVVCEMQYNRNKRTFHSQQEEKSDRYKTEPESTKAERKAFGISAPDGNAADGGADDGEDNEDGEEDSRNGDAEEGPSAARSEAEASVVKQEPAEERGSKENSG